MLGVHAHADTTDSTSGPWTTTVGDHTYALHAPDPDREGAVVVTRDGTVAYRLPVYGDFVGADGWRDVTGNGHPDIVFTMRTSRSTTASVALEATPRGVFELVEMDGRGPALNDLDAVPSFLDRPGSDNDDPYGLSPQAIKAHETADGYAYCVIPAPSYGGFALVLRDGRVAFRWPLKGPLPPAPEGQPADGPRCYPLSDLTGNGHETAHITDLTSRSTTQHVILDLGPEGISEVFNESLHFTQDLIWEDADGDGIREPAVSNRDAFGDLAPIRPDVIPRRDLDVPSRGASD
jgi:hypothetical protein